MGTDSTAAIKGTLSKSFGELGTLGCTSNDQSNGRLTFEDDLRSRDMLCLSTCSEPVNTELGGNPGVIRC